MLTQIRAGACLVLPVSYCVPCTGTTQQLFLWRCDPMKSLHGESYTVPYMNTEPMVSYRADTGPQWVDALLTFSATPRPKNPITPALQGGTILARVGRLGCHLISRPFSMIKVALCSNPSVLHSPHVPVQSSYLL